MCGAVAPVLRALALVGLTGLALMSGAVPPAAAEPDELASRFSRAQALSWEGRWDEALAEYDRLLAVSPDDPDYLFGKAQVLAWMGRPAEALPLLESARQRAPDYEALLLLERQVRAQLQPSQSLELGYGWQDLSRGLPNWSSQYLDYVRRSAGDRVLFGGLQRVERFDLVDVGANAGGSLPLLPHWSATFEGSVAPGADVLPRWSGLARFRRSLPDGWAAEAGARRSGYADNQLTLMTLGAERYVGDWYAAWTVFASRLQGGDTTWSNRLRVDYYYAGANRFGVIVVAGRETESVGGGRFTTNSTRGISVLGYHEITPRWGLNWELLAHEQGDAYTRRGFRAGIRHQF